MNCPYNAMRVSSHFCVSPKIHINAFGKRYIFGVREGALSSASRPFFTVVRCG